MIRSGHNFAHVTTAQLSWHVQKYGLIKVFKSWLKQKEFSQNFNYEIINSLWNLSQSSYVFDVSCDGMWGTISWSLHRILHGIRFWYIRSIIRGTNNKIIATQTWVVETSLGFAWQHILNYLYDELLWKTMIMNLHFISIFHIEMMWVPEIFPYHWQRYVYPA